MLPSNEKLYAVLPPWLQNVAISMYGLRWKRERLGGRFHQYAAEFRERDRCSTSGFGSYLEERLRNRLLRAFEHVPHYRKSWTGLGIARADLARMTLASLPGLPVTSKEALRRSPADFTAADVPSAAIRQYHSSGSTGTPVVSACTADDHRRFMACREARSFNWAGVSILSPRSMIGGRMVVARPDASPPFYRFNRAEQQVYFSAFHISPKHAANYVEGFDRHRPEVLTGYAQSYFFLGRMMLEHGLQLCYRPKALILSSEKVTAQSRGVIRKAFQARPFEEYGAVENCVLATECEHGGLHVHPDFGLVEIVDEHGYPLPPGKEGRVVCTGLLNDTQMLIRYEIGDIASWAAGTCACGRDHLPLIQEIAGRVEDVVIGADGREMVRFHGVFIDLPHVLAGQVIQEESARIRIRVIPGEGFGEEDTTLIRSRIRERLGNAEVIVETAADLERTPRGKIRAVVSRLIQ